MATTLKPLFRGAATTTLTTTLYTVPATTSTIVTNIVVTNTTSTAQTFDISLNGTKLCQSYPIAGFGVVTFDIRQVLLTTQIVAGGASAITVNMHISGAEIV